MLILRYGGHGEVVLYRHETGHVVFMSPDEIAVLSSALVNRPIGKTPYLVRIGSTRYEPAPVEYPRRITRCSGPDGKPFASDWVDRLRRVKFASGVVDTFVSRSVLRQPLEGTRGACFED
jgi:hypothetical protein